MKGTPGTDTRNSSFVSASLLLFSVNDDNFLLKNKSVIMSGGCSRFRYEEVSTKRNHMDVILFNGIFVVSNHHS